MTASGAVPLSVAARVGTVAAVTGVGVIGTGFMGVAHTEALRRLGLDVVGIVGSSPERARAKAARRRCRCRRSSTASTSCSPTRPSTPSTSPARTTSTPSTSAPSIAAGKHVVCEKPLGVSSTETAELLAARRGRRRRPRRVLQPPLLRPEPERRGARRRRRDRRAALRHRPLPPGLAAARHRLELAPRRRPPGRRCGPSPTSGRTGSTSPGSSPAGRSSRCSPTCTRSCTERNHPVGEVETFGAAGVDATSRGSASTWRATTPPGCCCASRTASAGRARSARSRPGARTRSSGRSTARPPRWRGRRRIPSGCGSATAAGPTRWSRRTRRS